MDLLSPQDGVGGHDLVAYIYTSASSFLRNPIQRLIFSGVLFIYIHSPFTPTLLYIHFAFIQRRSISSKIATVSSAPHGGFEHIYIYTFTVFRSFPSRPPYDSAPTRKARPSPWLGMAHTIDLRLAGGAELNLDQGW
ncbi:hypothetical protein BJY04DRAFT_52308 [Aspergillus karnatakaensis]|uniref:uncharacterized protein n=1 Tax=Aspergillus karnatakaensis TaxID=1810916 RepID=UPI003CCE0A8E